MLASGRYSMYTGILNPLSCSANLMNVCKVSMAYGIRTGMRTGNQKKEQHEYLLEYISEAEQVLTAD